MGSMRPAEFERRRERSTIVDNVYILLYVDNVNSNHWSAESMYRDFTRYLLAAVVLTLLVVVALVTLNLLDIPAGDLVDWVVGIVSVWWLLLVTTVPWNVHFAARAAVREAAVSSERGIKVDAAKQARIAAVGRQALGVALALHVLTAGGLYMVAAAGWSPVGYAGAALAAALTFVRPGARACAYLAEQVRTFRKEVTHPREDVVELRRRVDTLEATLDLKADTSWASTTQERVQTLVDDLAELVSDVTRLRVGNREEHARLEQEYRAALATVTEDRRFVEHLREIVRFVRTA